MLSTYAQTDISKFEGTWVHHRQAIYMNGEQLIGPHVWYLQIRNIEGKIIVRMKSVDADGNPVYCEGSGNISGNTLNFSVSIGTDYNYDKQTHNNRIIHHSRDYWHYKVQLKNGALVAKYNIYSMYYDRENQYIGDETLPINETYIYYNENDNW